MRASLGHAASYIPRIIAHAVTFASGLITTTIRPSSDSATAVRVQNAAGTTSLMTFDTTTPKVTTGASLSVTGTSGQNIAEFRDSAGALDALISADGTFVTAGLVWTTRTSAADNNWFSICYGNGLFVAVAISGTGTRVMTSPDGVSWTTRTSAADNEWRSVCYGNGLFVAVAGTGTGTRVMTSPDGVTWTIRASASDNNWRGVCYGNGLFVAVSISGTGTRVMTSPDGVTWTSRTSAADNDWRGVCYGNGLFVAVAITGSGNRVMTSPDGVTWTSRTSAGDHVWRSVCYGNGLFVAVAGTGAGTRVMTSPDGVTWTIRASALNNEWASACYGNGLFVAVAYSGSGSRVMTSGKAIDRAPLSVRSITIDQNNTTNATPVLALRQADVSEEFIRFIGTSTTDNSQSLVDAANLTTPGAIVGWIKVYIQDDQGTDPITDGVYYMPFYATPTA